MEETLYPHREFINTPEADVAYLGLGVLPTYQQQQ